MLGFCSLDGCFSPHLHGGKASEKGEKPKHKIEKFDVRRFMGVLGGSKVARYSFFRESLYIFLALYLPGFSSRKTLSLHTFLFFCFFLSLCSWRNERGVCRWFYSLGASDEEESKERERNFSGVTFLQKKTHPPALPLSLKFFIVLLPPSISLGRLYEYGKRYKKVLRFLQNSALTTTSYLLKIYFSCYDGKIKQEKRHLTILLIFHCLSLKL